MALEFLEYVESDGSQYILTDIVPSASCWGFAAEYMLMIPINSSNKYCLFGARTRSGVQDYQLSSYNTTGTMRYGAAASSTPHMQQGVRQAVSLVDGVYTRASGEIVSITPSSQAAPCPLAIFGLNENGAVIQNGAFRLYSLSLYDGESWREYRPAMLDDVAGLYDCANERFLAPSIGVLAWPGGGGSMADEGIITYNRGGELVFTADPLGNHVGEVATLSFWIKLGDGAVEGHNVTVYPYQNSGISIVADLLPENPTARIKSITVTGEWQRVEYTGLVHNFTPDCVWPGTSTHYYQRPSDGVYLTYGCMYLYDRTGVQKYDVYGVALTLAGGGGSMTSTGRNLATNSRLLNILPSKTTMNVGRYNGNERLVTREDGFTEIVTNGTWHGISVYTNLMQPQVGEMFTFSCNARNDTESNLEVSIFMMCFNASGTRVYPPLSVAWLDGNVVAAGEERRIGFTATWTQEAVELLANGGSIRYTMQANNANPLAFWKPKLERGSEMTEYRQAPEDLAGPSDVIIATDTDTLAVAVDVQQVDTYYYQTTSTGTAPAKPTTAAPSGWQATEYAFDATKAIWSCQKTTLTDGTFYWGAVSKASAYEGSVVAKNAADAAARTATSYIFKSTGHDAWVCDEGAGPNMSTGEATSTTTGWRIGSVFDMVRNGVSYLKMWLESGVAKFRIGEAAANRFEISANDLAAYDSDGDEYFRVSADGLRYGMSTAATTDEVETVNEYVGDETDALSRSIEKIIDALSTSSTFSVEDGVFTFSLDTQLKNLADDISENYGEYSDSVNDIMESLGSLGERVGDVNDEVVLLRNYVRIEQEDNEPVLKLGSSGSHIYAALSNDGLEFRSKVGDVESVVAYMVIENDVGVLKIHNAVVLQELVFDNWKWMPRRNGNLALKWTGA